MEFIDTLDDLFTLMTRQSLLTDELVRERSLQVLRQVDLVLEEHLHRGHDGQLASAVGYHDRFPDEVNRVEQDLEEVRVKINARIVELREMAPKLVRQIDEQRERMGLTER